jgi:hypothetical protein
MTQDIFHSVPGLSAAISKFVAEEGSKLLAKETFTMKKDLYQIDIVRDFAIPLNARMLSDIFYLDLRTDENKSGTLSTSEFYKHLLNVRGWAVNNNDPAMAWNRRRWAQEGAKIFADTGLDLVKDVAGVRGNIASVFSDGLKSRSAGVKQGSLRSFGLRYVQGFLAKGVSLEKTADSGWLNAFGGIGEPGTIVSLSEQSNKAMQLTD